MDSSAAPYIPIDHNQLDKYNDSSNYLIKSVSWNPSKSARKKGDEKKGGATWMSSTGTGSSKPETVSLWKTAYVTMDEELLLPEGANHVLTVVRKALKIGMHVGDLYKQSSGLEQLGHLNKTGNLSKEQEPEFKEKRMTWAAINVFSAAYYIFWELSSYRTEDVSKVNLVLPQSSEINLLSPTKALNCTLYYYVKSLTDSGQVTNELDFIKMTILYFESVLREIEHRREGALRHTESFDNKHYKLVDSEFSINGFNMSLEDPSVSVEFNKVDINNIVGNTIAKYEAERMVWRVLCYDFETKKNPILKLGGLPTVTMGYGKPGTGKSLLIAATATLFEERCRWLGIPFKFLPFPDNIISTFQGGSAERTIPWMKAVWQDPTSIVYGPIDDAENNLEERTRQGVSAGVREVIGVFLRYTEGAYAIKRGNSVIQLYTNIPEQIDKAVLSRVMKRFPVEGAKTREDFIDQEYLWWREIAEIDPEFIKTKLHVDYEYMSAQDVLRHVTLAYEKLASSRVDIIHSLYEKANDKHKVNSHDFYAHLYELVLDEFPSLSSRDIRNINSAVSARIMDFEFEKDWLEDPERFFKKSYDDKYNMLKELMKANMNAVSFEEIRIQETIQYLDNMAMIASQEFDRQVEATIKSYKVEAAARAKL